MNVLVILALTMQGEAGILSDAAAVGVGHVLQNRAALVGYGVAVQSFYGYDAHAQMQDRYLELAQQVVEGEDVTDGCLFVLSYQDVGKLFKHPACVRALADWQSDMLTVDSVPYRLYGYRVWPEGLDVQRAAMCDSRW